jgi:hypothetical protein
MEGKKVGVGSSNQQHTHSLTPHHIHILCHQQQKTRENHQSKSTVNWNVSNDLQKHIFPILLFQPLFVCRASISSLSPSVHAFISDSLCRSLTHSMRKPCCEKEETNKGAWSQEEDQKLIDYIQSHGEGCWRSLPTAAGIPLSLSPSFSLEPCHPYETTCLHALQTFYSIFFFLFFFFFLDEYF